MVDRSFVLKVRDHAPKCIQQPRCELEAIEQVWTAPEILRNAEKKTGLTTKEQQMADIYSIGIILQELSMECGPFPSEDRKHSVSSADGKSVLI